MGLELEKNIFTTSWLFDGFKVGYIEKNKTKSCVYVNINTIKNIYRERRKNKYL